MPLHENSGLTTRVSPMGSMIKHDHNLSLIALIAGRTPSENLFADHVVLYYMKGSVVRCMASIISLGEGRKEKGSEVTCKYTYYYRSTKDSVFI